MWSEDLTLGGAKRMLHESVYKPPVLPNGFEHLPQLPPLHQEGVARRLGEQKG